MSIKFYMNNPCEIVREITEDFSEIKVYPKYLDEETNGSDWCTVCQCGAPDGAYPSHDCGAYQDVINHINDSESAMIIVVENRLLQDKPVEFKAWKSLRNETKTLKEERSQLWKENNEVQRSIATRSQLLVDVNEEIEDAKLDADHLKDEVRRIDGIKRELQKQVSDSEDRLSIGGIQLSVTGGYLRELIKSKIILDSLERGGVDNWEWYGESLPDGDIDDLVQQEVESFSVKSI